MGRFDDPLQALIKKTHKRSSALNPAEQAVYNWHTMNPVSQERRRRAIAFEDMGEFRHPKGPYAEDEIKKDKWFVDSQRKKEGHMYKTERAEILETVFEHWAQKAGWFGERSSVVPTLEYDDRRNYTDFVVEMRLPSGEIARLAVDCVATEKLDVLQKKSFVTAKGLETNYLTSIKYFQSPGSKEKRKLKFVPRVIVAVENSRIDELCRSVVPIIQKNDNRPLANDYIQYYLLEEIRSQLEAQVSLVESGKVERTRNFGAMERNLKKSLEAINHLIKQKESSLAPSVVQRTRKEIKESRVFNHLSLLSQKGSQELRY
jgi:hypothetical protein